MRSVSFRRFARARACASGGALNAHANCAIYCALCDFEDSPRVELKPFVLGTVYQLGAYGALACTVVELDIA
jgi:hypothetical protein